MSSDMSACETCNLQNLQNPVSLRSIKQRYKTQSGYGRKESWQQKQWEFVRGLFDSKLVFDFD
jgi:hypothetical protein